MSRRAEDIADPAQAWEEHKKGHNIDPAEEAMRYELFKTSHHTIRAHNAEYEKGNTSFSMGHNHFSHLTPEEKSRYTGGLIHP